MTAATACGTGHSSIVARIELSDESGKAGRTNEFGDTEREVKTLARIQAWVTNSLVTHIKVGIGEIVGAAETFSHIVTSEFNMDAAGPGAFGAVGRHEASDFTNDLIEVTGLSTTN